MGNETWEDGMKKVNEKKSQEEKKRKEAQQKLQEQLKRLDYTIRAGRLLGWRRYKELREEEEAYQNDVKERFKKMYSYFETFEDPILKSRKSEHEQLCQHLREEYRKEDEERRREQKEQEMQRDINDAVLQSGVQSDVRK